MNHKQDQEDLCELVLQFVDNGNEEIIRNLINTASSPNCSCDNFDIDSLRIFYSSLIDLEDQRPWVKKITAEIDNWLN